VTRDGGHPPAETDTSPTSTKVPRPRTSAGARIVSPRYCASSGEPITTNAFVQSRNELMACIAAESDELANALTAL
jgi:hypothetical protein